MTARASIHLRRRRDLVAVPVTFGGRPMVVVKDPVTLQYFRLRPDEWLMLEHLDGQSDLPKLRELYRQRYPLRRVTLEQLQQLLFRFYQLGLARAESAGQGKQLWQRACTERRQRWLARFTNLLFIRLPGIDPDRALNFWYPWVRPLFSRAALVASLTLMAIAGSWVLVHFEEFSRRLPALESFVSTQSLLVMALTISVTKVLHELGHAFACKHFGGECHQLGLMWIIFTPALYCDTSDSWLFPSRWQRAAVGLAGVYVELVLASLATLVWWNSHPGWLHYLALRVMVISSVGSLAINLNPLLRFDGYFILCDLLNIPNLAQRSDQACSQLVQTGLDRGLRPCWEQLSRPGEVGFVLYSLLAKAYRVLVLASMLWFVSATFTAWDLASVGNALIAITLVGVAWPVTTTFIRRSRVPKSAPGSRYRRLGLLGLVAAIGGAACLVPLPYTLVVPAVLRPADETYLFVTAAGNVAEIHAAPGSLVQVASPILTLDNPSGQLDLVRLQGQRDEQQVRVDNLIATQNSDPQAAAQLPTAQIMLADLERQVARQEQQLAALRIKAPRAGRVYRTQRPADTRVVQPAWRRANDPLAQENTGAYLPSGTLVGSVGDPERWVAELLLQQTEQDRLALGQTVQVQLLTAPDVVLSGSVSEVAQEGLDRESLQTHWTHLPEVQDQMMRQAATSFAPTHTPPLYSAKATLNSESSTKSVFAGAVCQAKITVQSTSVAERLWRYVLQHWRF